MRRPIAVLALAFVSAAALPAQGPAADPVLAARIKELYTKREARIRVRDGTQLFTSIYTLPLWTNWLGRPFSIAVVSCQASSSLPVHFPTVIVHHLARFSLLSEVGAMAAT